MDDREFGLPPQQMAAAFPFHLVLDRDLKILQAGKVLQRIGLFAPGVPLGDSSVGSIALSTGLAASFV